LGVQNLNRTDLYKYQGFTGTAMELGNNLA